MGRGSEDFYQMEQAIRRLEVATAELRWTEGVPISPAAESVSTPRSWRGGADPVRGAQASSAPTSGEKRPVGDTVSAARTWRADARQGGPREVISLVGRIRVWAQGIGFSLFFILLFSVFFPF
jgi:hypothetical protein